MVSTTRKLLLACFCRCVQVCMHNSMKHGHILIHILLFDSHDTILTWNLVCSVQKFLCLPPIVLTSVTSFNALREGVS